MCEFCDNINREIIEKRVEKEVVKLNDLLCCPACNGNNVQLVNGNGKFDRVSCRFCGVTGPWFDGHPIDAVNGWNDMPREMIENRNMVRIQIEIPENFMNVGVTINNNLVADTNDSGGWDTLKFPLPDGKWSIYKTKGKIVILQKPRELVSDETVVAPESKSLRNVFGHEVDEFYPDDVEESDDDSITIDKTMAKEIITAMNDWLHQYASELCDDDRVRETYKRINESGGTLTYIAKIVDNLTKLINKENK